MNFTVMLISELIDKLTSLHGEYGEAAVVISTDSNETAVTIHSVKTARSWQLIDGRLDNKQIIVIAGTNAKRDPFQ